MKFEPFRKLSLAVVIVLLLLIVTSPVTTLWLIKQEAAAIVSDSLQGLTSSSLATMHVSEGFLDIAVAVNTGNTSATELLTEIEKDNQEIDRLLERHRETLRNESEHTAFDKMVANRADYRSSRRAVMELLSAGKKADADALFESQCVVAFQNYVEAMGNVVEHNATDARSRGQEIIKLCYILIGIQLLLLIFFFVYGFFVPLTAILERLTRRPVTFEK
ncbi:MCP four helix bundle domain-containing protein [Haloferula sp.]|uniref:MCP four helix bundle domain-containing protein n=1 Tax=Haloferula sp. TaxID=2497595 RepID=UPI003C74C9C0